MNDFDGGGKMEEEMERWVGIYFRVPESLKEEFKEAVAATYGNEKGAVGQCLRDLIKDFIDIVNRTESAETKMRILLRVLGKQTEIDNIPTNTLFSTIDPPAWRMMEEVMQFLWTKLGKYPTQITKKDFETIIANIRGKSRSTIWKWKQKLQKAGLIAIMGGKILMNYPVITGIETIEDMEKHNLFKNLRFAILSPYMDIMRLIYVAEIQMHPPHVAIIMLRAEHGNINIEMKDLMPKTEFEIWGDSVADGKPTQTNVGILKVMQALILNDGHKVISPFEMQAMTKILNKFQIDPVKVLAFPQI